mmetsp:Transcript_58897/g.101461  ORF Transcript_58897/g.101461 Transcript_58897/m.101461 type:complete len:205 (-) Transcript_58897:435-1049(-)
MYFFMGHSSAPVLRCAAPFVAYRAKSLVSSPPPPPELYQNRHLACEGRSRVQWSGRSSTFDFFFLCFFWRFDALPFRISGVPAAPSPMESLFAIDVAKIGGMGRRKSAMVSGAPCASTPQKLLLSDQTVPAVSSLLLQRSSNALRRAEALALSCINPVNRISRRSNVTGGGNSSFDPNGCERRVDTSDDEEGPCSSSTWRARRF